MPVPTLPAHLPGKVYVDALPSLLTELEVARHFNISTDTLRRLIARGEFPEGLKVSDQARAWHRQDVIWYEFGMCLRHRLVNKKSQRVAEAGQPGASGESDESAV